MSKRMGKLFALLKEEGKSDRSVRLAWATAQLSRPVDTFRSLTGEEITRLIDALQYPPTGEDPACDEPGCIGHDPAGWCVDEYGGTWLARAGA